MVLRSTPAVRRRPQKVGPIRRAIGWALSVALWGSCAALPRAPAPVLGEPVETGALMLWEATSPGGTQIHLLGTVHVGRVHAAFDPAIRAALARADVLALELAPASVRPDAVARTLARRGLLTGRPGDSVFDHVSPATGDLLRHWLVESGTDERTVRDLKPWAVWLMALAHAFGAAGLDPGSGTESALAEDVPPGLPVVGLERLEDQIDVLDSLPDALQEELLATALDAALAGAGAGAGAPAAATDTVDQMLDAWSKGDIGWIGRLTRESETATAGPVGALLIDARNEKMADAIARLVSEGHCPFVAVGAAHMAGPVGLPALLAARGYRVERVAKTRAPPED